MPAMHFPCEPKQARESFFCHNLARLREASMPRLRSCPDALSWEEARNVDSTLRNRIVTMIQPVGGISQEILVEPPAATPGSIRAGERESALFGLSENSYCADRVRSCAGQIGMAEVIG